MRSETGLGLVLALLVASALACADFRRGAYWSVDGDETGESGDDGEYGYASDVHALVSAGCERCHGVGNSAENTDFIIIPNDLEASYQSALEFVDRSSPGDSRLLTKMAGQGHGGGVIFDDRSSEFELVLAWIEQGAPP